MIKPDCAERISLRRSGFSFEQQRPDPHRLRPARRRAFLMEIDALYADVIVQRWAQFTGQKAERIVKEVDAA